jgi:carbonic anhydrase/acetyltransferase-like protein (isoleucine patch superfamily)
MIHTYQNIVPVIDPSTFIMDGVHIVGDVVIGKQCSIWYNAVIRGDVNMIRIGDRTNVQDNSVIHVTGGTGPCIIGSGVTIGHGAVIHAATLKDYCLIGMGATILDNVEIGSYAMVAAGSVVLSGTVVPDSVLVAGSPARIKRELSKEEREKLEMSAQIYIDLTESYRKGS